MRVFVVEPSDLVRASLRDLVHTVPGAVVVAEAGAAPIALERCRELEPDVVLLATRSASEALRFLVGAGALVPRPRVFVIASFVAAPLRARCTALGADDVFDKADEIDRLVARLHELSGALGG